MAKADCDVCCGRSKIRVQIHGRVTAFDPHNIPAIVESSREYPCPECSEVVPVERLAVVKTERFAASHPENDPRYIESIKYGMLRALAEELLERSLVKFERGPTDTAQMRFAMRMTMGVVSPTVVTTLQERVEQHQEALAREVMAEAARSINHWGSHYDTASLAKTQAVDSVRGALRTVLENRAKWKAA